VNLLLDVRIAGWLLVGMALAQCVPLLGALVLGEPLLPYAGGAAVAGLYGGAIVAAVHPRDRRMRVRDGFLVVSAAWLLASLFGAVPYVLADALSPVDALFESVAGFTTTGSTVLTDIEAAPRALLLWRSLTQWLGGMGIIVFAIAVLPMLGIGGMQLFRAEMPGPTTDKLTPRIAATARRLWLIYVGLTVLAGLALLRAGLGPFDALCHALTTLATGGFSTKNASIGAFGRPAVEWVVIVFMLLAGTNFALHYRILVGRGGAVLRDGELRFYLGTALALTAAVAWVLHGAGQGEHALRHAAFQVVSILTTTGYGTADYEVWPGLASFVFLPLLVFGGMAGSTSGGIKSLRLLIGLRALRTLMLRLSHPLAVRNVRYAGRPVDDDVVSGVAVFVFAYLWIATAAALVVASAGYDVTTSLSAALTAIGNVGPGLGAVGPTDTFAHLPGYAKLALAFCMLAGRLEIFTLLVLCEPRFWRR